MTDEQKADPTACIDAVLAGVNSVNTNQKAMLREWNLLRDYTHSLYHVKRELPRDVNENYHGEKC